MLPYDSFLIDPPWLASLGYAYGRLTNRFIRDEDRRRKTRRFLNLTTMCIFYVTSISLYYNLEWTRWIWEMCRAESGRDWMINSGIFHFDHEHMSPRGHAISAAIFATYPVALKLGYVLAERRGDEATRHVVS